MNAQEMNQLISHLYEHFSQTDDYIDFKEFDGYDDETMIELISYSHDQFIAASLSHADEEKVIKRIFLSVSGALFHRYL